MRHISREGKQPDAEWLAKANELLEELNAAGDAETRNEIIDGNARVWGELKEWLLSDAI
jgi:hypothetical protein